LGMAGQKIPAAAPAALLGMAGQKIPAAAPAALLGFVSGHGLSRAGRKRHPFGALAPAAFFLARYPKQ
jgi:hypothetical protein